jgi:hypothetical protein
MKKLENIDHNLPHVETKQKRKHNFTMRR